jgi:hypothetical protein
MANILNKNCCLAILVGAAISINIDVRVANADFLNDVVNRCIKKSTEVGLTPQEAQYCNRSIQLKNQQQQRQESLYMYGKSLDAQNDLMDQMANPVIIRPTNFGVGNN